MQSETSSPLSKLSTIGDFNAALSRGLAGLAEAGAHLVNLLDNDPTVRDKLRALGFSPDLLGPLERVGRRLMKLELFLSMNAGRRRLSGCSMSDQDRFSTEPVAVYDPESREERLIRVDELSPEQIRMVFARGSIRSVAQQRTWWSEKQQSAPAPEVDFSYQIKKDHIVILKPMIVRKRTLLDWFREIA